MDDGRQSGPRLGGRQLTVETLEQALCVLGAVGGEERPRPQDGKAARLGSEHAAATAASDRLLRSWAKASP